MAELRAVAGYAAACAEPAQVLVGRADQTETRPAAAIAAARAFAEGAPRSRLQRLTAVEANRAASELGDPAAAQAARAAGAAAAAAYLHPLAKASQVGHILGAAAHAAHAVELARGGDRVVAEYAITASATRASAMLREVLGRYPRAVGGRTRVAELTVQLDRLLRDPAPAPRVVDDPGPFFHGTRADLRPGELITPGHLTNYGSGLPSRHVYVTASETGAPLAAALARGDGPPRVYRVEPLGPLEDDPNVTDKRLPGNPTRSYRTREGVCVVEEVHGWSPVDDSVVARMRAATAELAELGIRAMD
ncbi:MAG TPA: NAD(+)--rifampin ADP-ribosyltransferase [Dermatophilaceae bacterium]|nr:NAD(+)--rifampin ADP-ribosyltransferase [Dermatophilaceae bacterium]